MAQKPTSESEPRPGTLGNRAEKLQQQATKCRTELCRAELSVGVSVRKPVQKGLCTYCTLWSIQTLDKGCRGSPTLQTPQNTSRNQGQLLEKLPLQEQDDNFAKAHAQRRMGASVTVIAHFQPTSCQLQGWELTTAHSGWSQAMKDPEEQSGK